MMTPYEHDDYKITFRTLLVFKSLCRNQINQTKSSSRLFSAWQSFTVFSGVI